MGSQGTGQGIDFGTDQGSLEGTEDPLGWGEAVLGKTPQVVGRELPACKVGYFLQIYYCIAF